VARGARPARTAWAVAGLVVAGLALLAGFLGGLGPAGGPSSSSFSSDRGGVAAYVQLLGEYGHQVIQLRSAPALAHVSSGSTVIVADPAGMGPAEETALAAFVRAGGHLVAMGGASQALLRRVLGDKAAPSWVPRGQMRARAIGSAPEVASVQMVDTAGQGSWTRTGATHVLVTEKGSALVTAANLGAGRVIAVADSSVVQNGMLASADNAQLAVDLVGGPGRPVVFDEADHGFGGGGLGALPASWRAALAIALAASVCWAWSTGSRNGPPERAERDLDPPRGRHLESLGVALAGTRDQRAAVEPVRQAARALLAQRAVVGSTAAGSTAAGGAGAGGVGAGGAAAGHLDRVARALDMPSELSDALLVIPDGEGTKKLDDGYVLLLGQALSWLVSHEGRGLAALSGAHARASRGTPQQEVNQ
jgi:hypothetical protein